MAIRDEAFLDKLYRKCSEEPFVPLGVIATTYFLLGGLKSYHGGANPARQQMFMRGRVAAQGFTVIAMFVGAMYGAKPHDRPATMEEKMERMKKEKEEYIAKYGEPGK